MQRKYFDIANAPAPPLRAEPRHDRRRDAEGHVRGVEATSGGLIRATLGSAAAAGAILVLFWLPAEYGIDATGLGRAMGLTQMGEIKQQLYAEAAAEDAARAAAQAPAAAAAPLAADPQVLARLAAIERQVAAIAAVIGAEVGAAPAVPEPAAAALPAGATAPVASAPAPATTGQDAALWRDEVSYTLAPGEGIEIKLAMAEGARAAFAWTANGAVLNYDTHGEGGANRISYEQGRAVPEQTGELVPAFAGNHGWFWRNRTDAPVVLTLRTRGDYQAMRAP
ncbi:hypothetical protein [Rubellimicrobium sp. CFH 75288]|uniref:hypothetical protein n=1 Tax=Rubellimicrobium sp. CFH 75288 TaxID=2697034 RepID=UPI00144FFC68|nr:hypothetical protein [Rubellimicrobium sp. CFH 75288]NAZ38248.1 hypothetical protein [Rubellimicrobium sp. CFH 75288]